MTFPFNDGVFKEGLQNREEQFAVVPERRHGGRQTTSEGTLGPDWAKRIQHIGCETEGDDLWPWEEQALIKNAIEVDVNAVPTARVDENVLGVTIPETNDVPYRRPGRGGEGEGHSGLEPGMWVKEFLHEPPIQHWWIGLEDGLFEHFRGSGQIPVLEVHVLTFLVVVSQRNICEVANAPSSPPAGMGLCLRVVRLAYEIAKRISIWNPFKDPAVFRQANDGKGTKSESPPLSISV